MICGFVIFELMNITYILLGGNIGDSLQVFQDCYKQISKDVGDISLKSSCYESAPWGFDHPSKFVNQVLKVSTLLGPFQLLEKCQLIESQFGRKRNSEEGYQARVIDIDILFFNDLVLEEKGLQIPHPRLHLRKFTLLPFSELNPNFIHPKLNQSISKLLSDCPDKSDVIII
jgi:2-amino-4-hydroxy-6-hydroxymethyldihydropteridine diphosphokinase